MRRNFPDPQIIRYTLTRLAASDPGLSRLKFASRVTLSVMSAVLVMAVIATLVDAKMTVAILAGILGVMSNVLVNDDTEDEQKVTTGLLILSSAVSVTAATSLSLVGDHLPDLAILSVVFLIFYLQRFGIRYFSLAMVSFISFYFSSLLHVQFGQLPWIYVAILVGVSVAYFYHFILFKNRPEHTLKRSMHSFHMQINLTFDLMIEMIHDFETDKQRIQRLQRNIAKSSEYARVVATNFDESQPQKIWSGIQTYQLRLYVFDAAMLVETLFSICKRLKDLHALEETDIRRTLLQVVQSIRDTEALPESVGITSVGEAENALTQLQQQLDQLSSNDHQFKKWLYWLRRIESISDHVIDEIKEMEKTRRQDLYSNEEQMAAQAEPNDQEDDDEQKESQMGLATTTKKAIQAAFAGAFSIVLGYLISPGHQYWILLSGLVILFGTESVGGTFAKAARRFIGTLLGAVVGFAVASIVAGERPFEIGFLFLCVFMAFYFVAVSYAIMIFWITMMLAMLYNVLLGGVTEQLLGARVLDTFIGAGLGASVTIFLFPRRSKDKVNESMQDFLSELKDYMTTYLHGVMGKKEPGNLANQAFQLDQQLQQIRNDAEPLMRTPGNQNRRTGVENRLTTFVVINYYAKHLVSSTKRGKDIEVDDNVQDTLEQIEQNLRQNIDILVQLIEGNHKGDSLVWQLRDKRAFIEHFLGTQSEQDLKETRLIYNLYYVWRINQSIATLAEDLGVRSKAADKDKGRQFI